MSDERPAPGWKVLLYDPVGQRWSDDWDGALHPTREDAEREAAEANESGNLGLVYDDTIVRQWAQPFRVVSADAVVINRDDIPDGLIKALNDSAHFASADGFPARADMLASLARLLSGGSPAAPEDGTDG